ncbi:MAG: hypothetical protein ABI205_02250, partial [Gemmatimonadaceae bacterium]
AFMTEVYKRKPAPPDWPMPGDIVTRQIDVTTNMLATPFCPREDVGSEFFIPGTDPLQQCDVHLDPNFLPDTVGMGALYPPGTYPPPSAYPASPYPSSAYPPARRIDTTRGRAGVVVPGAAAPIRRGQPVDTSRRLRDSAIFALPPRRDTSMFRVTRPRDTVRTPDSTRRVPRPDSIPRLPPDTLRSRP